MLGCTMLGKHLRIELILVRYHRPNLLREEQEQGLGVGTAILQEPIEEA